MDCPAGVGLIHLEGTFGILKGHRRAPSGCRAARSCPKDGGLQPLRGICINNRIDRASRTFATAVIITTAVILTRSGRICSCFSGVHSIQHSPVIGGLSLCAQRLAPAASRSQRAAAACHHLREIAALVQVGIPHLPNGAGSGERMQLQILPLRVRMTAARLNSAS